MGNKCSVYTNKRCAKKVYAGKGSPTIWYCQRHWSETSIEGLEKDFEIEDNAKEYTLWCKKCPKGFSTPQEFNIGTELALINHAYSHK